MKLISGSPAPKVQCTNDQYFDASKLDDGVKEFIIAPRYTGRMVFNDEYDGRSTDDFNYCCEYCDCKLERINDHWECPVHKEKWYRW